MPVCQAGTQTLIPSWCWELDHQGIPPCHQHFRAQTDSVSSVLDLKIVRAPKKDPVGQCHDCCLHHPSRRHQKLHHTKKKRTWSYLGQNHISRPCLLFTSGVEIFLMGSLYLNVSSPFLQAADARSGSSGFQIEKKKQAVQICCQGLVPSENECFADTVRSRKEKKCINCEVLTVIVHRKSLVLLLAEAGSALLLKRVQTRQ